MRKEGHSKLVWNKETKKIDTVDPHPQGSIPVDYYSYSVHMQRNKELDKRDEKPRVAPWMREAAKGAMWSGFLVNAEQAVASAYAPEAQRIEEALEELANEWRRYDDGAMDLCARELDALRLELFGEK